MTSLAPITERKIFTGTAAQGGGTFTADIPIPTDRFFYLRAWAFLTAATGSPPHLTAVGGYTSEYLKCNNNGTLVAPAAITGSSNSQSSTSLRPVRIIAQDTAFQSGGGAPSTVDWSGSGTNARLTVTNNGASQDADVTVVIEFSVMGSV